ncbi:MAG: hypothetical protein PHH84_07850, partial [Oscillospiraceae bacterium]|nr:hypothetical protein [Oscillospiraceae bacterium]
ISKCPLRIVASLISYRTELYDVLYFRYPAISLTLWQLSILIKSLDFKELPNIALAFASITLAENGEVNITATFLSLNYRSFNAL